jgi:hypothetical protein
LVTLTIVSFSFMSSPQSIMSKFSLRVTNTLTVSGDKLHLLFVKIPSYPSPGSSMPYWCAGADGVLNLNLNAIVFDNRVEKC